MSGSAYALGCRDESGVHPDGERLSGFVGGGLHGVAFGFGGADAEDLAAWVVKGRSAASFRLGHATENIRPRKVLTEAGFMGHNKGMTTKRIPADNICSGLTVIPPGKTAPAEVVDAFDNGGQREIYCTSHRGNSVFIISRYDEIEMVVASS